MNATLEGLQDLVAPAAVAKVGKYLPKVLSAALVAVIAWQLAKFTWLLLPRPAEPTAGAAMSIPTAAPKTLDAQKIADAHLFGMANVEVTEVTDKKTILPLVLAGTVATGDPTKGFAFIGASTAAAKFLRVGDPIEGGARLHSVYADRVMLERGGSLESLQLPQQDSAILNSRPPIAMNPPPSARFADNVKRIAETNPSAFSEILRPQPFIDKGVMQGFRVYPGRTRGQFVKLGFQPGDLVKAINGTPLDDAQRSNEIFGTISASDRVQLTIERNGQTMQLMLNTSQINLPPEPVSTMTMPPQDPQQRDPSAAAETQ